MQFSQGCPSTFPLSDVVASFVLNSDDHATCRGRAGTPALEQPNTSIVVAPIGLVRCFDGQVHLTIDQVGAHCFTNSENNNIAQKCVVHREHLLFSSSALSYYLLPYRAYRVTLVTYLPIGDGLAAPGDSVGTRLTLATICCLTERTE